MKEKKAFIKRNAHASQLSLVRRWDRLLLFIFIISLIICGGVFAYLTMTGIAETGAALMLISVPFLVIGLITYIRESMWKALLIAIAVPAALFYPGQQPLPVLFFAAFLMVGCVGVVSVGTVLQRLVFFTVISAVEYANIKDKLSIMERLALFLFNIPPNIDTRKITMDYNLKRSGIPMKDMLETMSFAFMVGIAMWIYLSMNPAFMTDVKLYEAPIFAFSLIMFIPLIVLPWIPFKSLNVRIETNYRPFSIYGGAVETLRKMAVPMFAVFIFILLAVNKTSLDIVITFLAVSMVFNLLIVTVSSAIFYLFFESTFIDDAVTKWKMFRPVKIDMELGDGANEGTSSEGTPKRDLSDIGDVEITSLK